MRVLTQHAENERFEFERHFNGEGCTCFIAPPCGWCTHPGNPINQAEDESCWMEIDDEA